jgi:hypothetical protein
MSYCTYKDDDFVNNDISSTPFLYLSDNPNREKNQSQLKQVLRGFDDTCSFLGELFFSNDNIDLIQKQLILSVYKKLNTKIPYQNNESLLIVMRRIYKEHCIHQNCNITEQIRTLNNITVDAILPDVLANITQHFEYIKHITEPRKLLEPPIHITSKQALPSITTKWNNITWPWS